MHSLHRTTSSDPDFQKLVIELDNDLAIRNGDSNTFFAQYNKIDLIQHVVVAYEDKIPVGCGAMKAYDATAMEIKRMFVPVEQRGKGIAACVLMELQQWAKELGYQKCVLETGDKMPEAIALYKKNGFSIIPNYGPYAEVESSVCFEKEI
ncbi:MAG: GNAT family N-acetyltransferase [Bacteroidia bacterium]|jgi:GNAT superfamily N-acetyltransferase